MITTRLSVLGEGDDDNSHAYTHDGGRRERLDLFHLPAMPSTGGAPCGEVLAVVLPERKSIAADLPLGTGRHFLTRERVVVLDDPDAVLTREICQCDVGNRAATDIAAELDELFVPHVDRVVLVADPVNADVIAALELPDVGDGVMTCHARGPFLSKLYRGDRRGFRVLAANFLPGDCNAPRGSSQYQSDPVPTSVARARSKFLIPPDQGVVVELPCVASSENTSAPGAKNYRSSSDYYIQRQELEGQWRGTGAERLDLTGTIDRAAWDRFCESRHPQTGGSLATRRYFECLGHAVKHETDEPSP